MPTNSWLESSRPVHSFASKPASLRASSQRAPMLAHPMMWGDARLPLKQFLTGGAATVQRCQPLNFAENLLFHFLTRRFQPVLADTGGLATERRVSKRLSHAATRGRSAIASTP